MQLGALVIISLILFISWNFFKYADLDITSYVIDKKFFIYDSNSSLIDVELKNSVVYLFLTK